MVNDRQDFGAAAERALALGYAPADRRTALETLFALDARLRTITQVARDPLIGTMRLTWWREALGRLDTGPAPAEPLLRSLAVTVLSLGVSGAALAALTEAWERMLEGDVDWVGVARERGGTLFALASRVLGAADPQVEKVGEAWAAVDLARDWPIAIAEEPARLSVAYRTAWPRALRPLGALGLLARFEAAGGSRPGSPRRVARLLAHRLTGR